MKIAVLYLVPMDAGSEFDSNLTRWSESYEMFTPGATHDLFLCYCNSPRPEWMPAITPQPHVRIFHHGPGWDLAAYQAAADQVDADLMVFMNTRVHFWRDGWLKRFVEAFEKHGPKGLYGASGSFEICPLETKRPQPPNPHIRTSCFACDPNMLRRFPYRVTSREEGFMFESGDWCFSRWWADHGWPVKVVTWDKELGLIDCRRPRNCFRKGDQSDMIVRDRHTDCYFAASAQEKIALQNNADWNYPHGRLTDCHSEAATF